MGQGARPEREGAVPIATDANDAGTDLTAVIPLVDCLRGFALMMERYRQALADRCGISINDSLIMIALLTPGVRHRPSDLVEQLGITSGSLTTMLDRLEAADMVHRQRHPTDRRSVYVELTPLGVERLLEGRDTLRTLAMDSIPPDLRGPVTVGLQQFTGALEAHLN